jgi:CheY-like chemotaxis protein
MRGWIVDDDPIFQLTAEQVFRQVSGWDNVETFLRAREALQVLQHRQRFEPYALPDAILLDLNMPVVDGWDFIDEWERESVMCNKKIRIIIVSASLGFSERNQIKEKHTVLAALDKPINAKELRNLLSFGIHSGDINEGYSPDYWASGANHGMRDNLHDNN